MEHGELSTWVGVLDATAIDELIAEVRRATLIGQRAGDFSLGRSLAGGSAAWSTGRCFNQDLEIRWWPTDDRSASSVLILNQLPAGWDLPSGWERNSQPLAEQPGEVRYLCVGQYDTAGPEGSHLWWETQYGRTFAYLDSAPAKSDERGGRVYLCVLTYELASGSTQHRLVRFDHARAKDCK